MASGHQLANKENTCDDARQELLSKLLGSGVLNSVKAHLRAKLFAELKGRDLDATLAPKPSPTLQQHVLNCVVTEYLLSQQYRYTLSVFLAESGTHNLPQLSHADLLRLVGVAHGSRVHTLLVSRSEAGSGCLAAGILEALAHVEGSVAPTITAGCQTDEQPAASTALLSRLAAIEEEYQERSKKVEVVAAQSVEARVAACQQECERRYAAQLQAELSKLKEEDLHAVREAEAAKAAHQLAADRVALKQSFQERVDKLQLQEEELLEKARKAQRVLDQLREEHDQRLQTDEERLRSWKAQEEAALAAKAVEATRRLEQADRQQRQAQDLQREAEQRLLEQQAAVQRDQQRHEDNLRQQQAALDMEREQLGRSRAHLAAQAAESDQLRRQLAGQTDLHLKEKMYFQQEVRQLQSQLQQLQPELTKLRQQEARRQQGGGEGPGGPPSEREQQLHQVVHILEQHHAQAQQELVACRAREQLWRESASTKDQLLDKAGKWHEQCLQHAEELRLALAAAAREVAHLQQQAQLVASEAAGPLGLGLAAACNEAENWKTSTLARLDAASQEEGRLRQELSRLQQRATAHRLSAAQALQGLLASYVQGRRAAAVNPSVAVPPVVLGAGADMDVATAGHAETGYMKGSAYQGANKDPAQGSRQAHESVEATSEGTATSESAPSSRRPADNIDSTSNSSSSSAASSPRQPPGSAAVGSRTTSAILAAYRARQNQGPTAGTGAASVPAPPSAGNSPRPWETHGQESVASRRGGIISEEENGEDICTASPVASIRQQSHLPGIHERDGLHAEQQQIQQPSEPAAGTAADEPSDYYLSDSEDSKF